MAVICYKKTSAQKSSTKSLCTLLPYDFIKIVFHLNLFLKKWKQKRYVLYPHTKPFFDEKWLDTVTKTSGHRWKRAHHNINGDGRRSIFHWLYCKFGHRSEWPPKFSSSSPQIGSLQHNDRRFPSTIGDAFSFLLTFFVRGHCFHIISHMKHFFTSVFKNPM